MWTSGEELPGRACRVISISMRALSRYMRIQERNVRALVKSLIAKLSIEIAQE
jgi:hypothetical protein